MKRFHVTYRYLATGMEGRADEHDYGIFEAADEAEAKGKAADAHCKGDSDTRHFFIGCLTAHEMVAEEGHVGYDKALAGIKAGKMQASALWMLLSTEADRREFGLKPDPWEGPGEYQQVSKGGNDLGWLVRLPSGKSLPVKGKDAPAGVRQVDTIDMTPTWGEMGTLLCRLVRSNEVKALKTMWPEVAKAFAMAQAAKEVMPTLHPDTQATMRQIMQDELRKQQQAVPSWAKGD